MTKKPIPIETLRALLICDPAQGKLFWKHRPLEYFAETNNPERACAAWNARYAGKEAFTADKGNGYLRGAIFSRPYLAHRVIWAMATGAWPPDQIDHINGDRADNRIENLRAVTSAENQQNAAMRHDNTSGVVGVSWHKAHGKWQVQIRASGKNIHLGYFNNKDEAVATRATADIEYGFHENHGRMN
jgi:hypothetical protein